MAGNVDVVATTTPLCAMKKPPQDLQLEIRPSNGLQPPKKASRENVGKLLGARLVVWLNDLEFSWILVEEVYEHF